MKDIKNEQLRLELDLLLPEEIEKEIMNNKEKLESENISVKDLAKEIYTKRGIDTSKIKKSIINNLMNTIEEMLSLFKNKDKKIKNKMFLEIIYIILLIILVKIPFDLVRDIGYEYLELITKNSLFYTLWNLACLLFYTITIICTLIVLINNFNKKYKDA